MTLSTLYDIKEEGVPFCSLVEREKYTMEGDLESRMLETDSAIEVELSTDKAVLTGQLVEILNHLIQEKMTPDDIDNYLDGLLLKRGFEDNVRVYIFYKARLQINQSSAVDITSQSKVNQANNAKANGHFVLWGLVFLLLLLSPVKLFNMLVKAIVFGGLSLVGLVATGMYWGFEIKPGDHVQKVAEAFAGAIANADAHPDVTKADALRHIRGLNKRS